MTTRKLGNTDIEISPIILGMWQAGKRYWNGVRDSETSAAVRAAFDAGVTTFDTAEIYGDGHSESILGAALEGVRQQAVVMTKLWTTNMRYDLVRKACEASLQRLRTDYIDLYQIHWPSGSWNTDVVPIADTMRALEELRQEGKIRAIGVSNFDRQQTEEAAGHGTISSIQPPYSLFWRHVDRELRPYCQEHGISILAYSPLAQGLLTGRFRPGDEFAKGDPRGANKLFQADMAEPVGSALTELGAIAEAKGCTMAQLALAWAIAQPMTCAIPGARNPEQAQANAGAMAVALSADEVAEIDRIGRRVSDRVIDDPLLWTWKV